MTSSDSDPTMIRLPARRPYAVGYAKPPVESRFREGQSGNPRGRPRGSGKKVALPAPSEERMKTLILEEAYRGIPVRDGTRQVTLPMVQAVLRALAVNAVKGPAPHPETLRRTPGCGRDQQQGPAL